MTPTAIKWLLYDLLRTGSTDEEITETLQARGATYADLVAFITSQENK